MSFGQDSAANRVRIYDNPILKIYLMLDVAENSARTTEV